MRSRIDAPVIDEPRDYLGRPGISPSLASLVSAGMIRPDDRILDVGCGRGTDLVALAKLGFSRLEGLDHNAASLRAAKRRERDHPGRHPIQWHLATLDALLDMPPRSYDWIIDSFLINNLRAGDEEEYVRRLARLLPKDGGLLLHSKYGPRNWERDGRPGITSPHFDGGPPVFTWWAEGSGRWTSHASGFVQVLRRNARAVA